MATPTADSRPANRFGLSGDDITVDVMLTGIDGKPSMSYRDGERDVGLRGEDLTLEQTALGLLCTGQLAAVPDLGTTNFSVVLPVVNAGGSDQVETVGITAVHHTSFSGAVEGQATTYRTHRLTGTASAVVT